MSTLYINEELVSRMPVEVQEKIRIDIALKKKELEEQEAEKAKTKRQYELRKHPTLQELFKKINAPTVPHIRNAVLKRIHIILDYLRMPALPNEMEPDLEYSLGLLGRAEISLKLIEEIGTILQDVTGYTFIKVFPREMVELRDHIKAQQKLATKLVLAITFNKVKETGIYEPKDKEN
jgi:hypothetical protein